MCWRCDGVESEPFLAGERDKTREDEGKGRGKNTGKQRLSSALFRNIFKEENALRRMTWRSRPGDIYKGDESECGCRLLAIFFRPGERPEHRPNRLKDKTREVAFSTLPAGHF